MGLHFVYLDPLQVRETNLKYSNAPNLHNMGGGAKFERDFFHSQTTCAKHSTTRHTTLDRSLALQKTFQIAHPNGILNGIVVTVLTVQTHD